MFGQQSKNDSWCLAWELLVVQVQMWHDVASPANPICQHRCQIRREGLRVAGDDAALDVTILSRVALCHSSLSMKWRTCPCQRSSRLDHERSDYCPRDLMNLEDLHSFAPPGAVLMTMRHSHRQNCSYM